MKPSIPKGTRDFSPQEMVKRNYIFDTIKTVYQRYGYMPLETPSMENVETLLGKYGDEGDKLIFRILNSGNFMSAAPVRKSVLKAFGDDNYGAFVGDYVPLQLVVRPDEIINLITEKALRYDLTVPFARYVVMHQNEITFPFKRYQIQPVWRADRPQKGRYREFYQCDADVIGSNSLLNEVELIQIIDDVFSKLGLKVLIKINNRKILQALAILANVENRASEVFIAIDKLDKIGFDKVVNELISNGFTEKETSIIGSVLGTFLQGKYSNVERISQIKALLSHIEIGKKGIEEIEYVFNNISNLKLNAILDLDITLARGLNYYTGAIFEVKVNDERSTFTGSILGGGRYDDLTGIFGLPNVSGVGISFGADRIYDVMEELKLFPESVAATTKIMFVNFGSNEERHCLKLIQQVRAAGINAEFYPDQAKMKKQMSYADSKKIPFVALVGEDEIKNNLITLKDMNSGEQEKITIENIIDKLKI